MRRARIPTFLLASTLLLPLPAMATEEPRYDVVAHLGAVEIRSYPPILWAETTVEGEFDRAGNAGFRRLASYIFGGNRVTGGTEASAKIAMTAPVAMRPARGERIAMTAPVAMRPAGGTDDPQGTSPAWVVAFAMPGEWTLETIPRPVDLAVSLREAPARMVAALRFSGTWSSERFADRERELLEQIAASRWRIVGPPETARYDPPWTPWFMRRNEVLVEVQPVN